MISWTHHPLVDAGMATLCAMVGRPTPDSASADDLEAATDELEQAYFSGLLTSYLTCVFMNSAYVQPAMKREARAAYRDQILKAFRRLSSEEDLGVCNFCGRPAVERIHRGQAPMLTGQDTLNFYAGGAGGLAVCGICLTALQALPFGCKRVEGKLLAVHADHPVIRIALARVYVADTRRLLALAKAKDLPRKKGPSAGLDREVMGPTFPDSKSPPSLLTSDLLKIFRAAEERIEPQEALAITCYWLSSSGKGPSLDVFHLPSNLIRFLWLVSQPPLASLWASLVARAWREPAGAESGKSATASIAGGPGRSRNDVLNDLIEIYRDGEASPDAAVRFVRRRLLKPLSLEGGGEWQRDAWPLTTLFLTEVLGMTQQRINSIQKLADQLASYMNQSRDRQFFRQVVFAKNILEFRGALVRGQRRAAQDYNNLLLSLKDYLDAFEAEDAVGFSDWRLIRDLISIRLVESLHELGFFEAAENKTMLDEPESVEAA